MKVKVNKDLCIACGACIALCPDVFEYGEGGKSEVKKDVNPDQHKDCIKRAESVCPVHAIEVEE